FINKGPDRNTRILLFAANLQLGQGETPSSVVVNLVGSNNQSYQLPAEDVRPVPNFAFTQVVFRLPDTLVSGTCTVTISAHGQTSNSGTFRASPGAAPSPTPTPTPTPGGGLMPAQRIAALDSVKQKWATLDAGAAQNIVNQQLLDF